MIEITCLNLALAFLVGLALVLLVLCDMVVRVRRVQVSSNCRDFAFKIESNERDTPTAPFLPC